MARVFISYRRSDSAGHAGRLFDRLTEHFGRGAVFMDIDDIPPGEDFAEVIEATVRKCESVIVLIGPGWLDATDEAGKRRIDNPDDFVGMEVAVALDRSVQVLPVLVGAASMPRAKDLPVSIAALARRNAIEIRDTREFHRGVDLLIEAIERPRSRPTAPAQGSVPAPDVTTAVSPGHVAEAPRPEPVAASASMASAPAPPEPAVAKATTDSTREPVQARVDRPSTMVMVSGGIALIAAIAGATLLPKGTSRGGAGPSVTSQPAASVPEVVSIAASPASTTLPPAKSLGGADRAEVAQPSRAGAPRALTSQATPANPAAAAVVASPSSDPPLATRAGSADRAKVALAEGYKFFQGEGVPKDYKAAARLFRESANLGDPGAQGALAYMFDNGYGVKADLNEAVRLYRAAAEAGSANAQSNYGSLFVEGRGVPRDYAQALVWYRKAAAQNDSMAQSNLGLMYENGWGVLRDVLESIRWYQRAAGQGDKEALASAQRLINSNPQRAAGSGAASSSEVRNIEFESIKNQMKDLGKMQQGLDNALDKMREETKNRHIKAG